MRTRILIFLAAASMIVALTGCGGASAKKNDISPIFPLSSDKCAKYGGEQKGSGITATCMVTKAECERAAADWRKAMASSGVNDAIQFRCD
jgi:hypothetical protein